MQKLYHKTAPLPAQTQKNPDRAGFSDIAMQLTYKQHLNREVAKNAKKTYR